MALTWTLPDPVAGGMGLENPSRSGGVAQNGQEQVIGTLSMRQRAQWTVPLRNAAEIKAARVLFTEAQGKANSILVPVFEPKKSTCRPARRQNQDGISASAIALTLSAPSRT
jgi:hypothetical protein